MNDIQKTEITEMRLLECKLLIIEFNKASQLDRSFGPLIPENVIRTFRANLIEVCLKLMNLIDVGGLTNTDIRNEIRGLIDEENYISFGQAQKVINVVLKQYCFLLNKKGLYKELDCPLDSTTMRGRHTMRGLIEEQYIEYQNRFERENGGIRILADQVYDFQRIEQFLE